MPGTTRRGFYQLLGKETTSEEETDESINLEEELQYDNDKKTRLLQRVGKSLAIMLISLAALMVYTWAIYLAVTNGEMKRCTRRLAPWTPALDAIRYETRTFEGDFYRTSKYRGTPSKEIDQAWDDLWKIGGVPVRVPESKLPALNKSVDRPWTRIPESMGGGIAGYTEVFHQLHCLNVLRKATYKEYYTDDEVFRADPVVVRAHQDHCIEMLRMQLMCVADMTPLFTLDIPSREFPLADFNSIHVCRNFDELVEWQKKNVIHGAGNWDTHKDKV